MASHCSNILLLSHRIRVTVEISTADSGPGSYAWGASGTKALQAYSQNLMYNLDSEIEELRRFPRDFSTLCQQVS